jgi:DNA-binding IclR family transcriptional regulator
MKLTLNRLKIFEFFKNSGTWVDVHKITHHTGVNTSVVNKCLRAWVEEEVLVRNDTFHAYLYRLADEYEQRSTGKKLATALRIFQELGSKNSEIAS